MLRPLPALLFVTLCGAVSCGDAAPRLPPADRALNALTAAERATLSAYFDAAVEWAWRGKGCVYHALELTDGPAVCEQERALCETQSPIATIETARCHAGTADLSSCDDAEVGDFARCVDDIAELTRRLLRDLGCSSTLPTFPYAELVACGTLLDRCPGILSWD